MSNLVFWVLVALATVTSIGTAWTLGANSNSPPFAPAIGANAISTMRAAFLIGILAALGALTQGGNISETVGAGLINGVQITSLAATAGLLTATVFMAFGVYSGYPVPAAFATTGAMVGVGLSLGGSPAIETYQRIALFWALVPPVSGGLAYLTAKLLRRDDIPETVGVPLLAAVVGGIVANIEFSVIPTPPGVESASLAGYLAGRTASPSVFGVDIVLVATTVLLATASFEFIRRRTRTSVDKGIKTFLVLLGIGAGGILGGAWMGAPRLLQATSREYAQLGVRRSIAALVPGFIIAQAAIALGIPISFNNIIISGVIGGGLAGGSAGVSRRKIGITLGFWLLTLGASIVIGFGMYRVFATALGV